MDNLRLSTIERNVLRQSLDDFQGEVFIFGSRANLEKRGGDIDILLKPRFYENSYALKSRVVSRFEKVLEQSLDVVVFDDQSVFCQEIIKNAKLIDLTRL